MAKIPLEQLNKLLQPLRPVYLITGDEPLLVQEGCDAVRAAAKQQGFSERELFHAEPNFNWHNLLQSANSLSLFADKKLFEVRLPSGKLNEAGSHAILQYCAAPQEDNLLLLVAPKLEKSAANSKWFKTLEPLGVVVTIWPVNAKQLPRWIEQRLQRAGLKADSQAIDILASRVEGNLLAAVQEIEKLKLLSDDGMINSQIMASAVVDSARYNVFGLLDKALAGQAQAAATTLIGLKGEGGEPTIILWAIAREIRALIALKQALHDGQRLEFVGKRYGIFDSRLPMVRGALQRLNMPTLRLLLRECSYADRTIKGMSKGDPWLTLLDLILTLAGTRSLNNKVLSLLIQPSA